MICILVYGSAFGMLPRIVIASLVNMRVTPSLLSKSFRNVSMLPKDVYMANFNSHDCLANGPGNSHGDRPLHTAVECILQDTVDYSQKNLFHTIDLQHTFFKERVEILKLLITYGANPYFTNNRGDNVFDHIRNHSYSPESNNEVKNIWIQGRLKEIKNSLIDMIFFELKKNYSLDE